MNKTSIFFVLCFLILTKIAFSSLIEVDISEDVKSEIIHETITASFNIVNFSTEFYNTGSVPYDARARIFVYNEGRLIFSGWSQKGDLMPGDKKTFDVYWYASSSGNYESKLRVYFGNEIIENEKREFQIKDSLDFEDVFIIENFRTYDDHVVFDIVSKKDVENVIIIPSDYVSGWIFEQKTIENIKKDLIKTISIVYQPTVWKPTSLKIAVVAENGKFYSEKIVEMEKGQGITSLIYSILDNLKLLLF
jgi:hypothetical protein